MQNEASNTMCRLRAIISAQTRDRGKLLQAL
jgi:hypothetical protein